MNTFISRIETAWADGAIDADLSMALLAKLDRGEVRVASFENGRWTTHDWVKKGILLAFRSLPMQTERHGVFESYDKIPLKSDWKAAGVRAVPGSIVRLGAHIAPSAILMPSFVNVGAYVGARTMVDTWATVGSCAQIGADVHLSGGVGIGGVLEPPGAQPVIIEDGVFVGSRAIIVEGALIESEAVIGANTVITASTPIIDVTGPHPVEYKGHVPSRSVVIPGSRKKQFPAGEYQTPCALIIGRRTPNTDRKVSLNSALRDFDVSV